MVGGSNGAISGSLSGDAVARNPCVCSAFLYSMLYAFYLSYFVMQYSVRIYIDSFVRHINRYLQLSNLLALTIKPENKVSV